MGNLGFGELLMIFAVALVIFGPRKLPEIGRTIGKALGEFRRATNDLKNTLEEEVRVDEVKRSLDGVRDAATEGIDPAPPTVTRGAAIHREVPKHSLDTPPDGPPAADDADPGPTAVS